MKLNLKPALIFILLLCSCKHPIEKVLPNKWDVVSMNMTKMDAPYIPAGKQNEFAKILNSVSFDYVGGDFLNLKDDHTYTSLSMGSHFFYGKWVFNKAANTISLTPQNGDSLTVLKIVNFDNNQLVTRQQLTAPLILNGIKVSSPITTVEQLIFKRDSRGFDNEDEDYTTLKNNEWRIKPTEPETVAQINKRVKACLNFAVLYLESKAKGDEDDGISLKPIPLPITIAVNGIQLQQPNEIGYQWKELFYDDVDAMIGYKMVARPFGGWFDRPKANVPMGAQVALFYIKQVSTAIQ